MGMQPISMAPFPPRKQLFPVSSCERLSQRSVSSGRKNQNQFLSGGKGVLKPVAPFFPRLFSTGRKRGQAIWSAPKTFMCGGRGEAHLPPFHCLLLLPAASAHLHGGARDCHPREKQGRLRRSLIFGVIYVVAVVFEALFLCCCRGRFRPLPCPILPPLFSSS
jgi:hypothetical protein